MSDDISTLARQKTSYKRFLFAPRRLSLKFEVHSKTRFQHMLTSQATQLASITIAKGHQFPTFLLPRPNLLGLLASLDHLSL